MDIIQKAVFQAASAVQIRAQNKHIHRKPCQKSEKHRFVCIPASAQINKAADIRLLPARKKLSLISFQPADKINRLAGQLIQASGFRPLCKQHIHKRPAHHALQFHISCINKIRRQILYQLFQLCIIVSAYCRDFFRRRPSDAFAYNYKAAAAVFQVQAELVKLCGIRRLIPCPAYPAKAVVKKARVISALRRAFADVRKPAAVRAQPRIGTAASLRALSVQPFPVCFDADFVPYLL